MNLPQIHIEKATIAKLINVVATVSMVYLSTKLSADQVTAIVSALGVVGISVLPSWGIRTGGTK